MNEEEIIIINDKPFYRILNGTSYNYASIPKEFKPYFERLQQENQQLKDNWNKLKQKMIDSFNESQDVQFLDVLQDMQELEQGSDNQ